MPMIWKIESSQQFVTYQPAFIEDHNVQQLCESRNKIIINTNLRLELSSYGVKTEEVI
jgi:hypothetical protein